MLSVIFQAIVPEALRFVRRSLKETVTTVNHNLVLSLFNVFDSLVLQYVGKDGECCAGDNNLRKGMDGLCGLDDGDNQAVSKG